MVTLLMPIGGYFINGYWGYILMHISAYFINGYLVVISGYSIDGYWWLLY